VIYSLSISRLTLPSLLSLCNPPLGLCAGQDVSDTGQPFRFGRLWSRSAASIPFIFSPFYFLILSVGRSIRGDLDTRAIHHRSTTPSYTDQFTTATGIYRFSRVCAGIKVASRGSHSASRHPVEKKGKKGQQVGGRPSYVEARARAAEKP